MTQVQVKVICKAFGFNARYSSVYGEWCLTVMGKPHEGYYTNDRDDVVYTALSLYRTMRSQFGKQGMIPESAPSRIKL